jgi:anti-sigma-K factor RskA
LHLLTGAYVVDALTGAELAEFERHLYRCGSCAEEVRRLRETTTGLGMAAAIAPPPEMRPRVLAAATHMRQLPPSARPGHGAPRRPTGLRRVLPRPVTTVAVAALVAAIVVLSVLQVRTRRQLQEAQAGNRVAAAVLAAPDARLVTGGTTLGGTMTAVVSPHDREAVITTVGMPVPTGTKVYQLWVISAAGARSAGLLPPGSTGVTSPVLAADVQPGDKLAITVEPAGGTPQPTTTPIVLLSAPI